MLDFIGGLIARHKRAVFLSFSGVLACIYLVLCAVNIYIALALAVTCMALYVFYKNIDAGFMLYIILLPFGYAPIFAKLPFGIGFTKILLILSAVTVSMIILYKKPYKIGNGFNAFFIILSVLYCIAWVRSLNYALVVFSDNAAGKLPVYAYLLDYVSWTVMAIVPLFLIAYYCRDQKGIEKIVRTVAISVVLLLGYLIFVYLFQTSDKSNFEGIRAELAIYAGMHGNDLANFCLISFPLILAWALYKKGKFAIFTLFIIVAGTAVCFSRTAYFLVLFGFFLFLLLSGKRKWIPAAAIAVVIALYLLVPDMIIDRAVTGLNTGDYNELTAGRIELLWKPILNELGGRPGLILFGSGRFGLTNMDVWRQGRIPPDLHAHNMYLDCILDTGVFGLIAFLAFFILIIVCFGKNAMKYRKASPYYSNLLNGCMVSVICYMISGFTGRSFFPAISNIYLWVVIGLGIAISRYIQNTPDPRLNLQ